MESLEYHGVPPYLRAVIGTYLRGRKITYLGRDGAESGLLWSSTGVGLGPTLWNVGYDGVLRGYLPPGLDLVCYADDTLVLARGKDDEEARARTSADARLVVNKIRRQGLFVALQKTETFWFYGPRRRAPARSSLRIDGVDIPVGHTMKYLGLTLDSRWDFRAHFDRLAPRLKTTAAALSGLLPNLGGPSRSCRRGGGAVYGAVWRTRVAGRTQQGKEPLPLEGVPKDHRHTDSERVPHHLLRGGVRTGRVYTLGPGRGDVLYYVPVEDRSPRPGGETRARGDQRPQVSPPRPRIGSVAAPFGESNGRSQGRGGHPPNFS